MNQTAINYGQVLLELAVPREDIESSRQIWESSLPLRQALTNPVIQNKQKNKVIDKIFPSSMHSFMKIVCKYQEESLLSEIFQAYDKLEHESRGILCGTLYCVKEPDKSQLEQIDARLCRELNARQVVLHVQPDKSLIGGFIIRIGDLEIDQSILGSMNCLKEKLIWR